MRRNDLLRRLWRAGATGTLAALLAAPAAAGTLSTGGMMLQMPKGPARADLPSPTAVNPKRPLSAAAYGFAGRPAGPARFDSVAAVPEPSPNRTAARAPAPSTAADPAARPGRIVPLGPPHPFSVPEPPADAGPAAFADAEPFAPTAPAEDPTPPAEHAFAEATPLDPAAEPASPDTEFGGLKGVCPVTLREERRSVAPRPDLFSEYDGRRYQFATPEAKAAFDADPARYAPALGGRDVVLTAAGADDAVGKLEHAGFYRERLYLFRSAESCKTFYKNPRKFVAGE